MNISNIDLNLLVIFKAIYEQRNISKVALNLGLSQPTISHALKRLRETFNDELFIRSKNLMSPTSKANQIGPFVIQKLDELEQGLFENKKWNPLKSNKTFNLSGTSYDSTLWLPRLSKILKKQAPDIQLNFRGISLESYFERMLNAEVDLSFGVNLPDHASFNMETLNECGFSLIAKKSSYKHTDSISLSDYLSKKHALYTPTEKPGSVVDDSLKKIKKFREIAVKTPYLDSIPLLVCEGDLLSIIPDFYANRMKKFFPIKVFPLPIKLPRFKHQMVWHKGLENSQEHMWLRDIIKREYPTLMS
jgi:DNA-binding transcriptional LysR family regulator